ncbi:MAG: aspartate aminotransferase family protein [Deltaproteobacteria bacterium]|jgi:acetylornithine aminotransferase|nr:aspartate aminotransferase family protein [Deltaproteobacteria bacterium]
MSQTFNAIKAREEALLCRTYGRYPLTVARAQGSRLWDCDGKEYVDLLAGIAVTALGHCNEELAQVAERQARKLIHVSNLFYQEEQLALAQRLLDTCHMGKVFFCNSGAEANEAAVKLARRYMQRVLNRDAYEVVTFSGCFHGRTLAMIAATGGERFQDGFAPMPEGFVQAPWGDMDALRALITPKTAAILLEAVQGEGGIRPLTPGYAKDLETLCREKDILFLADEVQCGLGRTGRMWAFQHFGLRPDILTSAKALANGLPLGAMLATDKVAAGFVTGSHATTFGGGALISVLGGKVLEIMERDKLTARAGELGARFKERLEAVGKKRPGTIREVRGLGLMIGVDLAAPGKPVWEELIRRGFVCNLTQDTVLRLLPALTIDEADLAAFADTLEDILAAL